MWSTLHAGTSDARSSLRAMIRSPGLLGATILTTAIGVGASASIFSMADAVLFRPLPGVDADDELIALYTDDLDTPRIDYQGVSWPDFIDYREQVPDVALAAFLRMPMTIGGSSFPVRVIGDLVSRDYFAVLGTAPAAGRLFAAGTDGGFTIVISHRLWQERFGGRPDAMGKTLVVNGVSFAVAGVAPPGFRGSLLDWYGDEPVDLFAPLGMFDRWNPGRASLLSDRTFTSPQVVGRLRGDVTLDAARLIFDLQSKRLQAEYPGSNGNRELLVLPAARARFWPGRHADAVRLLALAGAGGLLLLLLVCGNLINLWLPRIMARRREIALRLAVGAGRTALARSLLFEVPLLTAAAAVCGIGIASALLRGLAVHSAPFGVVLYRELEMDTRSWLFAFGVAACVSTVIAAGQWVCAVRCRPVDALRAAPGNSESRASVRGKQVLIAGQVALSFVLLAVAGSLARSLHHLSRIDPGYDAARVLVVPFEARGLSAEEPLNRTLFVDLLQRIRRVPGVESASISNTGPLSRFRGTVDVAPTDGGEADRVPVVFRDVGPDYFETIDLRLLRGVAFGGGAIDPRAVVVNENLAARLWPGGDAVGRFLEIEGEAVPRRVIGVVDNAAHRDLRDRGEPYLYRQILNRGVIGGTILIRTRSVDDRAASRIRSIVNGVSGRIVVLDVRTLRQDVRTHLSRQYLAATVAIALSVVAVVLIAVGTFGLVSTTVAQRRRELGIRLAFGAGRGHVVFLALRDALLPSTIGTVLGSSIWWLWTEPVLAREAYGIDAEAAAIVWSAAAGLAAVTAAAAIRPALRAANVEPLEAMRAD